MFVKFSPWDLWEMGLWNGDGWVLACRDTSLVLVTAGKLKAGILPNLAISPTYHLWLLLILQYLCKLNRTMMDRIGPCGFFVFEQESLCQNSGRSYETLVSLLRYAANSPRCARWTSPQDNVAFQTLAAFCSCWPHVPFWPLHRPPLVFRFLF